MSEGRVLLTTPRRWAIMTGLLVVIGLFNTAVVMSRGLTGADPAPLGPVLICELSGSLTMLPLLPILLRWFAKVPVTARNLSWSLPLHLVGSLVYGASHTFLMEGARDILYVVLGFGAYDRDPFLERIAFEYQKQVIVYCGVAATVALLRANERHRHEQLRAGELERQLTAAELDRLKMQLNPHFLFNTLNLIACLVRESPERAERTLGELGDFLRMSLRHAETHEVPLAEDLRFLRAYLSIMEERFGAKLRVEIDVPETLEAALVPHLVLQPLVENAVKVATSSAEAHGAWVSVVAEKTAEGLDLVVRDDGPGPGAAPSGESAGIGLSTTRARLNALYGSGAQLVLSGRPQGGAEARISLPLRWSAP